MFLPMVSLESKTLTQAILRDARRSFRQIEGIQDAVRFFRKEPQGLIVRVDELESVCRDMNAWMKGLLSDPRHYQHVEQLRHVVGDREAPFRPTEILEVKLQERELGGPDITKFVSQVFSKTAEKINSGEWQLPEEPGRIASALLLNWYALFLSDAYEVELSDTALALGEIIFMKHRNGLLFADLRDWFIENRNEFPPGIRGQLEYMAQQR